MKQNTVNKGQLPNKKIIAATPFIFFAFLMCITIGFIGLTNFSSVLGLNAPSQSFKNNKQIIEYIQLYQSNSLANKMKKLNINCQIEDTKNKLKLQKNPMIIVDQNNNQQLKNLAKHLKQKVALLTLDDFRSIEKEFPSTYFTFDYNYPADNYQESYKKSLKQNIHQHQFFKSEVKEHYLNIIVGKEILLSKKVSDLKAQQKIQTTLFDFRRNNYCKEERECEQFCKQNQGSYNHKLQTCSNFLIVASEYCRKIQLVQTNSNTLSAKFIQEGCFQNSPYKYVPFSQYKGVIVIVLREINDPFLLTEQLVSSPDSQRSYRVVQGIVKNQTGQQQHFGSFMVLEPFSLQISEYIFFTTVAIVIIAVIIVATLKLKKYREFVNNSNSIDINHIQLNEETYG